MMDGNTSGEKAHRVAWCVEVALLLLTGLGIAALIVIWVQLDSLLTPQESAALVRARLLRGIFSLAVPLVILLFLSKLRVRFAALLQAQNATQDTMQSARYMWILVVAFVIIILIMDAIVIANGFLDIDFI